VTLDVPLNSFLEHNKVTHALMASSIEITWFILIFIIFLIIDTHLESSGKVTGKYAFFHTKTIVPMIFNHPFESSTNL
jgi:hypothetical protein